MRSGLRAVGALRSHAERAREPVALETAVVATGARPGDTAAKRELFTEETQTVLVFENGAVIRLSAAVADGQLLFLTNKKTGKEVVTQVIRKRSFRPTSCYVDLEFTEASPGFWEIEFPKAAATSPAAVNLADLPEEAQVPAASTTLPPNVHEVERLKSEVAELQNKLKSLIASGQSPDFATRGASAAFPQATASPADPELSEGPAKRQAEDKALEQLLAQEAEQERRHGPTQLVSYPKKSSTSAMVKKAGKVATAGAIAAVIVAAGVAAYRFGLLDSFIGKTMAKVVPAHTVPAASPAVGPVASAKSLVTPPAPNVSNPTPPADIGLQQGFGDSKGVPAVMKSASNAIPGPDSGDILPTVVIPRSGPAKASVNASSTASREARRNAGHANSGSTAAGPTPAAMGPTPSAASLENEVANGKEDYTGPRLLFAVKPVSPPEALRNYITGNVNLDALVDATGHVKSVSVISGPDKLRKTAVEDMKQYVYEPARKNGKAVASHVQTSMQFWYEP
jgi:periplasmic protein TonB